MSASSVVGGFALDLDPLTREGGADSSIQDQNQFDLKRTELLKENLNGESSKDEEAQPSEAFLGDNSLVSLLSEGDNVSSNADMNGQKSIAPSEDGRSIKSDDESDDAYNIIGKINVPIFPRFENDPLFWLPPEPADVECEKESVAFNDDDDVYSDGTKWGQSNFSSNTEEHETTPNLRHERQKAMLDAMNGQLKILASRFLASASISFPKEENGKNWLDMVTSLSWEAALLIKPDANVGKEMDPGSYVKVKCVASGSHQQSEVVRGLVFKKNTAHKHMPTKFLNPRLLLLAGVLGHSDVGLSSLNSMDQEKGHLEKAIGKMMETCNPNVILVEKTVSRDIQEVLLKAGVTLVLDMKRHRLDRIARCTGSPIISFAEVLKNPKLKQCDSFRIEKFTEEHNSTEGGKKPSKTLMFLEGFPRPLGCTVLLRGANSEELKKVKQVMQYTIFAAYHLILETSFFEDQRVFLNDANSARETPEKEPKIASNAADGLDENASVNPSTATDPHFELGETASDGLMLEYANGEEVQSFSADTGETSHLSTNYTSNIAKELSIVPYSLSLPHQSGGIFPLRKLFSHVSELFFHQNIYLPVTSSQDETNDDTKEVLVETDQVANNVSHTGVAEDSKVSNGMVEKPTESSSQDVLTAADSQNNDQPESLLVLSETEQQSTNYISKEARHSEDDDMDSALDTQSILILLSSQCIPKQTICDQSHLSRIKYYGNFDVSLGQYLHDILYNEKKLTCSSCREPPESHMYSYTHRNGNLSVLVRRLPLGHHLSGETDGKIWMWTRCLRCEQEHGFSKPTPRVVISNDARKLSFGKFLELSFSSRSAARRLSICGHLVNRDCLRFFGMGSKVAVFRYSSVEIYAICKPPPHIEFFNPNRQDWFQNEVVARGWLLFSEVENSLQQLKNNNPDAVITNSFDSTVKGLPELEDMLLRDKGDFEELTRTIDHNGRTVHQLLDVNWLHQELLLGLFVWDHRLHQLLQYKAPAEKRSLTETLDEMAEHPTEILKKIKFGKMPKLDSNGTSEDISSTAHIDNGFVENGGSDKSVIDHGVLELSPDLATCTGESEGDGEVNGAEKTGGQVNGADTHDIVKKEASMSVEFGDVKQRNSENWIWAPFSESLSAYKNDLLVGCLERFDLINKYSPCHLTPLSEKVAQDTEPIHYTVGPGCNVLTISEDEVSSIISRALAVLEDKRHMDIAFENGAGESKLESVRPMEKSNSLTSESSMISSTWSSIGSFDSESSFSSASSSFFSEDVSSISDSSLLSLRSHVEVTVNGRVGLKGKYSVISLYANNFFNLRKKCCSSELAYIASLSRCKKWDAQGGKSKAFFAKTMDDRFIIKQIKKTEFDSFLKFAPDYFNHVSGSLDSGSQTCLAKILGIYAVKHIKNGKEVRTDLMVMENLLFGHNISRTYDLKGAVFSRHVAESNDHDTVYLDQNFIDDMRVSPLYIDGRTKNLLQRAIWNDTAFLTTINVMDYSLLVGVDKEQHQLVFGIIDYLRQYTWDKQLETWVKTSLVVPKNVSPTVISPKEYKKRFRKFMTKYFLTVPDTWSSENSEHSSGTSLPSRSNSTVSEPDEKPPDQPSEPEASA